MQYSHNGQAMSTLSVPAGAWEELRREVRVTMTLVADVEGVKEARPTVPSPKATHSIFPACFFGFLRAPPSFFSLFFSSQHFYSPPRR